MKPIGLLVVAALLVPLGAAASNHQSTPAAAAAKAAAPSEGEVRKVDKDAGKVTVKHGPLVNLDMPAMTMAFKVKDPAMLTAVKPGDTIRFRAEMIDGAYTITEYRVAAR